MKKIAIIGAILLLLGGGTAWFLRDKIGEILAGPPPAAFTPGAPPVYVSLGKMQIPVFDGGALAGLIAFEATIMVPDDRAKEAVGKRLVVLRDLFLRDMNDIAMLIALSGKPVAIDQIKTRLSRYRAVCWGQISLLNFSSRITLTCRPNQLPACVR